METLRLSGGAELKLLKSEKFKTLTLGIDIYRPLKNEATANALLVGVLKHACAKYPEKIQLEKQLEWMYGARFGAGIRKKGEVQVLGFEISAPVEKYTGENMSKMLSEFLYEIVYSPKLCSGIFDENIVAIEKENLKNRILSLKNDKKEYATQRMIEEMCKDEAYSIYEYGSVQELDKLDAAALKQHYDNIIKSSKTDIFAIGECDETEIKTVFDKITATQEMYETKISPAAEEIRIVEEEMDVTQGKLVIGMKADKCDYYDLLMFNSIFGSGTHSKLFNNVREKLSLAYYAYSRLVRQKSLIIVGTGIEFDKYEMAKQEIFNQLDEMKKGNITDFELQAAKSSMINAYRSLTDTPATLIDFYTGQTVSGKDESIEDTIKGINAVTKEGIMQAAAGVTPDTVYFLKGIEGNE